MEKTPEKTAILAEAARILDAGGVVSIPTETVYGLAARIDRETGLRQVFALKERPFFDPLIVHLESSAQALDVVSEWPKAAAALAAAFWPGPLTLVLPKKPELNGLITAGLPTVGIRVPDNSLTLSLIRAIGVPLAAPSANKFKRTSPTIAEHVRREFPGLLVLDTGPTNVGIESTVAAVQETETGAEVAIYRPGMISDIDMKRALADAGIRANVRFEANSPASPGTLSEHYQPAKPLLLLDSSVNGEILREEIEAAARRLTNREAPKAARLELGPDPAIAARRIFAELHRLSLDPDVDIILCAKTPENSGENWRAIWDRLGRAAKARLPLPR